MSPKDSYSKMFSIGIDVYGLTLSCLEQVTDHTSLGKVFRSYDDLLLGLMAF